MQQQQRCASSIDVRGLCVFAAMVTGWTTPAVALVTCTGGQTCTQSNPDPRPVNQLPFTAPSHADACDEMDQGQFYPTLPITHQGTTYPTIPTTIAHDYTTCTSTAFNCTGSAPANATLCAGDDAGLTADTARILVAACTAAKCEYTCDSGFIQSGSTCIPQTFSCTGPVPADATLCAGSDTGLTADTPRTLAASCTGEKCAYTCDSGFELVAGTCSPVPLTGTWGPPTLRGIMGDCLIFFSSPACRVSLCQGGFCSGPCTIPSACHSCQQRGSQAFIFMQRCQ